MSRYTGAGTLLVAYLRRDRWMLLAWIGGAVALYWSQAVGTLSLYTTQADLDQIAASVENNPALIAMTGPAQALDTIGGQVAWQSAAFGSIVAGLMAMFLVTRHTRAEEESGRDEVIRSSVVGRDASVLATGLLVVLANLTIAVGITASLVPYDIPFAGSLALGIGAGLNGIVFGAVALLASQLVTSSRAANALTGAVIAIAYVLRAVGDVGPTALSWLSPIGWGQAMRAYADERWWPAGLLVAATVVLVAAAVVMLQRRDFGGGAFAARPGPARGGPGTDLGLAWRLQRTAVLGWGAGMFAFGLAYGTIGDGVEDLVGDSAASSEIFRADTGTLTDSFYAIALMMLGLIACGFAVASVLRLRSEESSGHAESVLATSSSRTSWSVANLTVTLVGTVAVVLLAGAGIALSYGLVTGDAAYAARLFVGGVQQAVAVIVVAAVAWIAYAIRPRLAMVGWAAVAFCVVVLLFGTTLQLPTWVMELSPFERLALYPVESVDVVAVLALAAVAVVLLAAGVALFRRRDIVSRI